MRLAQSHTSRQFAAKRGSARPQPLSEITSPPPLTVLTLVLQGLRESIAAERRQQVIDRVYLERLQSVCIAGR